MAEKETAHFKGAGGAVFEMDLPLAEPYQYQAARGQLVRVNPDGTPYTGADEPTRPAANATKAEWVGWARHVDKKLTIDDADAMTKNDLIEKYGQK